MTKLSFGRAAARIGISAAVGAVTLGWSDAFAQGTSPPVAQTAAVQAQATAAIRKADTTVTIVGVRSVTATAPVDLFARVTIAGDTSLTRIAAKPNLRVSMTMPETTLVPVRLELFEKRPPTFADQLDVNQIAGKRDIDFVVDPVTCTITGFSQVYKCGDVITRTGQDSKPGEIAFRVDVAR
jgi:hypothetical protein